MNTKAEVENEIRRLATPSTEERIAELEKLARDMNDPSKLHPDLRPFVEGPHKDGIATWKLRHPYVYSVLGPLLPHQCNEVYRQKMKYIDEAIAEKNWSTYLWLHERPYRMDALESLWDRRLISKQKMRKLLLDFWTDTEIPQGNQDEPLKLFRVAGFSTDDRSGYEKLPSRMRLYRGVDGVCELTSDGPSWTRSRKVADFFAVRHAKGKTYSVTVQKGDPAILAWITGRDEAEIILDFDAPGSKLHRGKIKLVQDFSLDTSDPIR